MLGKLDEATAVPSAVKQCFDKCLPRMRGSEAAEYRQRLAKDREAQFLISSYEGQLDEWARKLKTSLAASKSDPLDHWSKALDARRCIGNVTVPITDRQGQQQVYRASLSAAQARLCFLEAQREPNALSLGKPFSMFETPVIIEALARCGEVKYGGVEAMDTLTKCVGGMVRNIIGKANEVEVLTEAVVGKDAETTEDYAQRVEETRARNWEACW